MKSGLLCIEIRMVCASPFHISFEYVYPDGPLEMISAV